MQQISNIKIQKIKFYQFFQKEEVKQFFSLLLIRGTFTHCLFKHIKVEIKILTEVQSPFRRKNLSLAYISYQ